MIISSHIFKAYLQCHTKCWQLSRGEVRENNVYEEWLLARNQNYRANGLIRLSSGLQSVEYVTAPPINPSFKSASWRLASEVIATSRNLESCIHAVERISPEGQTISPKFVPIRFEANNKLTKLDNLLIAFDSLILADMLKREITHGEKSPASVVSENLEFGELQGLSIDIKN